MRCSPERHYFRKAGFVRRSHAIRPSDVDRMNEFDIIFIFREALMTRSTRYEEAFRRSGARIVFDFDDAIWLTNERCEPALGLAERAGKTPSDRHGRPGDGG